MTDFSLSLLATWLGVALLAYFISTSAYSAWFGPLARIPGPKLAAFSNIWYCYHWIHGSYPKDIRQLHEKYGPVVRIAPKEVSFATPQSFQDIYGHVTRERPLFPKATFYELGQPEAGIVAERHPEKHRNTRRLLSHGFSSKALKEQEFLLHEKIEILVAQLKKYGHHGLLSLNITTWYNWLSFDVIGSLAFGASFGALSSAKSHFWIETIHDAAQMVGYFEIGRRLPLLWPAIILALPAGMKAKFDAFLDYSRVQTRKRVGMQGQLEREDFFSNLLSSKAKERDNEEWLLANANVLVIAGSDTTATALTAITYFLAKNQEKLKKLQDEVHNAFSSTEKIDGEGTARLSYLNAVIEEGLRLFPPTAFGLPRESPGAIVDGHWMPKGTTVSTSSWTTTHSEEYFAQPEDFIPERWLPDADPQKQNHKDNLSAAQPFSLGPRACLGLNLAYLEMRMTLARLAYSFNWVLSDPDFDFVKAAKFEGFWLVPEVKMKMKPIEAYN